MEKKLAEAISVSKAILGEFDLCDHCLGRMFAKKLRLQSNQRLGKRIRALVKAKGTKCYICRNLFDSVPYYVEKMQAASECYDFETFLVGAKLRPSVLDRDDHIRSKFRLIGADAVKTAMTRHLAKQLARRTGKKSQFVDPDVTFMVDFKSESCSIQSKPVYLFGRYTKKARGIPQKQRPCENCQGKGCVTCSHHGIAEFDSVEGMISKYLFERFGAAQARITWIGGEDVSSLVLGAGRPFFVKLLNPKRRRIRLPSTVSADRIEILNLKQTSKLPTGPVQFSSQVTLLVSSEAPILPEDLAKLDSLEGTVAVYDSGKRAEKFIKNVSYRAQSASTFSLSMTAEGGLPLKRLVSGENVFPNVSDLLGAKCRCETFDFEQVTIAN